MPATAAALCRCSGLAILTLLLLSRQTVAPRPLAARRRAAQPPHLGRADRLAAIAKGAPDVAAYLPLRFEAKFSSPCWRNGSALRCLPRLFLAGAMQCGVPDLWERLRAHALLGALRYDAQAHWWTNHPRSRAGYFERYVSLYSGERTAAALEAEPRSVLADASPASFTLMMAEELRLHYLYLDAFDNCYRRCRNQKLPEAVAAKCADRAYGMEHCYPEAEAAAVPLDFNVPSFVATVLEGARPVVVALLREPAARLWISLWFYGQFPAKYGATNAGFGYYFGNQSAAFASCAAAHGTRRCALRFEAHGPEQAAVYYHCDQLIKGMYSEFLPEWQWAFGQRLLVFRAERYFARPARVLHRVWRALGLRAPTDDERAAADAVRPRDELADVVAKHGEPPAEALARVRAFYAPGVRALSELLGDDGGWYGGREAARFGVEADG